MVVLPAWVPPATTMFWPASTAASRKRAACGGIEPSRTRSFSRAAFSTNLRMFTAANSRLMPFEHDVQPVTLRQHRVDERLGQVDASAAGLEHPLDQLLHLGAG